MTIDEAKYALKLMFCHDCSKKYVTQFWELIQNMEKDSNIIRNGVQNE